MPSQIMTQTGPQETTIVYTWRGAPHETTYNTDLHQLNIRSATTTAGLPARLLEVVERGSCPPVRVPVGAVVLSGRDLMGETLIDDRDAIVVAAYEREPTVSLETALDLAAP